MPATFGQAICGCRALDLVAKMAAGFGYDLDAALDQPALAPVRLECRQRDPRHLGVDQLDGFDNIGQARASGAPGHQNTCNAEASMRCLRSG